MTIFGKVIFLRFSLFFLGIFIIKDVERKHIAHKFRIYPDEEQKVLIHKHCGSMRFIYNRLLQEKQQHYLECGKSLNYNACSKFITQLKKEEEFSWLKEVNSQSLQQTAMDLETAYGKFFKKIAKFPKFKRKSNGGSFRVPQNVKIVGGTIKIGKFKEGIPIRLHRQIKGEIRSCTVSMTPSGKYFASILAVGDIQHKLKTGKSTGVDVGIKDLAITSDGQKFKNPKITQRYSRELAKAQKHLSRKQKDSNRYQRQRQKVARIHEKITNSRNDNLHKLSTKLVSEYDLITVEDLAVKNMVKNRKLSKSISDCGWGRFVTMLGYKCDWYGKKLVKIDRFYPSSKTCSCCNHIKESLSLNERKWKCPKCDTIHDRDVNAANNILRQGLSITDMEEKALTTRYEGGETNSSEVFKKKSKRKYTLKPRSL